MLRLLLAAALLAGCRKAPPPRALLETSMGRIEVRLLPGKASEHFAALAQGQKQWVDAGTKAVRFDPFYTDLPFERVIPGFVIQTSDRGGLGYAFDDEPAGSRFDRPGLVGLSNEGPGAAGGGIFITLGPAPVLDGRHAVLGEVVSGLDVARRISEMPREAGDAGGDRPLKPVVLKSVTIVTRR